MEDSFSKPVWMIAAKRRWGDRQINVTLWLYSIEIASEIVFSNAS